MLPHVFQLCVTQPHYQTDTPRIPTSDVYDLPSYLTHGELYRVAAETRHTWQYFHSSPVLLRLCEQWLPVLLLL